MAFHKAFIINLQHVWLVCLEGCYEFLKFLEIEGLKIAAIST